MQVGCWCGCWSVWLLVPVGVFVLRFACGLCCTLRVGCGVAADKCGRVCVLSVCAETRVCLFWGAWDCQSKGYFLHLPVAHLCTRLQPLSCALLNL
jgi:hypothetical protein